MNPDGSERTAAEVKSCCARLYESDWVRMLLGESFHPGGLELTTRLGELVGLHSGSRVLDVASGTGSSALHLAEAFGSEAVGVDYSAENVREANRVAAGRGLDGLVRFETGDSERLPFPDGAFDALISECAFCTFPDKPAAAAEFYRVLRPGGRVGISDITREPNLPAELDSLTAWIACIGDARPAEEYAGIFREAGFRINPVIPRNEAVTAMIDQIRTRLFGLEVAVGLGKLDLPGVDFSSAKEMAAAARQAVDRGQIGYAILTANRQ